DGGNLFPGDARAELGSWEKAEVLGHMSPSACNAADCRCASFWSRYSACTSSCAVAEKGSFIELDLCFGGRALAFARTSRRQNRTANSLRRRWAVSLAVRIGSAGPVVGPIGTNRTLLTPTKRKTSRR